MALIALAATISWVKEPAALKLDRTSVAFKEIFFKLMRQRSFRVLLYFSFIVQFAMSLFEGTFALHADKVMGFGPPQMGLVLMVCGLVMAVAQGGVVSWFIDRIRKRGLIMLGFTLMGISLMLLMIPRTMLLVLMLTAVFGLGMALLIPILATMVSRQSISNTGAVLGVQNAVNSLGQAMGPLAGGLLFTLSIHLPYLLTGIVLMGSTALLRNTARQKTRK